jgi:hypothetical protein
VRIRPNPAAMDAEASGSTSTPALPTTSGIEETPAATTGVPQAIASSAVSPKSSCSDGSTRARAPR